MIRWETTTEETFYPAIRDLLTAVLRMQNLPFEVRTGTSPLLASLMYVSSETSS